MLLADKESCHGLEAFRCFEFFGNMLRLIGQAHSRVYFHRLTALTNSFHQPRAPKKNSKQTSSVFIGYDCSLPAFRLAPALTSHFSRHIGSRLHTLQLNSRQSPSFPFPPHHIPLPSPSDP